MNLPLVSIIMPNYNSKKYLLKSIESVINQSYEKFELIICDDYSQDGSLELMEEYARNDTRIIIIKNEKNMGVSYTRNRCLELATGNYIAFLDSDDIWSNNKLSEQIMFMEENNYEITYTPQIYINENGNKIGKYYCPPEKIDYDKLKQSNVMGCSTVIIHKNLINGHTFTNKYMHEDFILWLLILKGGNLAYCCNEAKTFYRKYSGSKSGNKLKSAIGVFEIYKYYLKLNIFESIYYMIIYSYNGFKKHFLI